MQQFVQSSNSDIITASTTASSRNILTTSSSTKFSELNYTICYLYINVVSLVPTPTEAANGPTTSGISILVFIAVLFSIIIAVFSTIAIATLITCVCSRRMEVPTVRNEPSSMYDTQEEQHDDDDDDDDDYV